jgi:hypothetical protein
LTTLVPSAIFSINTAKWVDVEPVVSLITFPPSGPAGALVKLRADRRTLHADADRVIDRCQFEDVRALVVAGVAGVSLLAFSKAINAAGFG